jgi:hypothetical protein
VLSRGRCYAPECAERVIVVDGGVPIFVGEIAHIVAALPSGPRGSESVADREGFDNLLVLCGRHHKVIDNSSTRDRYPVAVLRAWKADREAEFDTATVAELRDLTGLSARLPGLLIEVFHDTTTKLEATVGRLEAAGQLSHEMAQMFLASLAAVTSPGPDVGDGVPGLKEAFEEAYDAAGGASFLGVPSADAYETGPGVVQHLRGARCGHPAVICALAGRPAVIIAAVLWNAIARVGAGQPDGGVVGVGLPSYAAGGDSRYIDPRVTDVRTVGGSWGPGTMRRTGDDRWQWIPDLAFDANNAGNADTATGSAARLDLRLRLAAEIPFAQAEQRLTASGRRRLAAELAEPRTTTIVSALAAGRVAVPADLAWRQREEPYARNDSWGATYDCLVSAADGRPAISGTLQLLMPNFRQSSVTSLIDIAIDVDGCRPTPDLPGAAGTNRLSHQDVADVFTRAWTLAFDLLPTALDTSDTEDDPGRRPRVDLYVINERPEHTGGERNFRLGDLVDLSGFGTTKKTHLHRLDMGVLGRGRLPAGEAREVIHQALIRAAEDAGFDAADLVTW